MLIKASRITNLTDARYFAAKEVDFLGFNLEEGTDAYLDPMYMKAIREWVQGPKITGEFSRSPAPVVREYASFFGLDAVQVTQAHRVQLPELEGLTVILALEPGAEPDSLEQMFHECAPYVAYFLVQFNPGTSPLQETEFWRKCAASYPLLLGGDIPGAEMPAILEQICPAGIGFTGGEEEQVGVKSFDEIEEIFELLGR